MNTVRFIEAMAHNAHFKLASSVSGLVQSAAMAMEAKHLQ